ncbi:membrane protein [Acrocarpospora pleiomorpha]|uniref:Membrane protein n=1 Tax=Acrocarpospora pleiomorpha TaxID=90975 RepID=A0A5M3XFL4_9ACTN|nr:YibE/F family protein [Acrocarpospora pleiomorpha]GES20407.1 membrane protein [Acrocarpospora pleiomorpha]
MGANHTHGPVAPASHAARWATLAVIVPLAVATLVAVLWMWPGQPASDSAEGSTLQKVTGMIVGITLSPCPEEPPLEGVPSAGLPPVDPATCGDAQVRLTSGQQTGQRVIAQLPSGPGSPVFGVGDDIVLIYTPVTGDNILDEPPYRVSDYDRTEPLLLIGAAFALAVIAFGRWRGVTALVGLAITFVLLLTFVIPAILAGQPPLLVAIAGSAAIMLAVLYLTHGFTVTTSVAIVGTLCSLSLTGGLSYAAIGIARLSGITDDSSLFLDMSYRINTQGLLMASILIGALGVLDDVTVTQSVTVAELARVNPGFGFRELYRAATRIGRAHIASVINTIILAYAGASLPLLLLISVGREPLGEVLTNPVLAQEIVRSVVGTLGLISAVPLTTALAVLAHRPRAIGGRGDEPLPSVTGRRRSGSDHGGGEPESAFWQNH